MADETERGLGRVQWLAASGVVLAVAGVALAWVLVGRGQQSPAPVDTVEGAGLDPWASLIANEADRYSALMVLLEAARTAPTTEVLSLLGEELRAPYRAAMSIVVPDEGVRQVAYAPDGRTLFTVGRDGHVRRWDAGTGAPIGEPFGEGVRTLAFHPDGLTFAAAGSSPVQLWDAASNLPTGEPLPASDAIVNGLAFSPDGGMLVATYAPIVGEAGGEPAVDSDAGGFRVWDLTSQPPRAPLVDNQGLGNHPPAFSQAGPILAMSNGWTGGMRLWNYTWRPQTRGARLSSVGDIGALAFSPDGRILASGDENGTVVLQTSSDGENFGDIEDRFRDEGLLESVYDQIGVSALAFSPDGDVLASGDSRGTVLLWDVEDRESIGEPLSGHERAVHSAAFNPDGGTLATAGYEESTVRLWNLTPAPELEGPLEPSPAWIERACAIAGRNPRGSEWDWFFEDDTPYVRLCPDLPPGRDAPRDAPAAVYPPPLGPGGVQAPGDR